MFNLSPEVQFACLPPHRFPPTTASLNFKVHNLEAVLWTFESTQNCKREWKILHACNCKMMNGAPYHRHIVLTQMEQRKIEIARYDTPFDTVQCDQKVNWALCEVNKWLFCVTRVWLRSSLLSCRRKSVSDFFQGPVSCNIWWFIKEIT